MCLQGEAPREITGKPLHLMARTSAHRSLHRIIEQEKNAYLEKLPPCDPDWPPDVRIMYEDLCGHLFEAGLTIQGVKKRCGIGNNNVSSRFKLFVGRAPKKHILHHRMELAKRLLRSETLSVTHVAFAVGYESPNGFATTFKRRVGVTPSAFRRERSSKC